MDFLNSSDVDVAHYILSQKGEPIYYRDLITEVIAKRNKPVQSLANTISEVYTLINMDSRFRYMGRSDEGKSMWGLSEWVEEEPKKTRASRDSSKSAAQTKQGRRREELLKSIQED